MIFQHFLWQFFVAEGIGTLENVGVCNEVIPVQFKNDMETAMQGGGVVFKNKSV